MPSDTILRLAGEQHGVVASYQLLDAGLTRTQVHRMPRHHGWMRAGHGVLRRTGTPDSPEQRVAIAVLGCGAGAVLSHDSGASWWGHPGPRLEHPVHVAVDRVLNRRHPPQVALHTVRELPDRWVRRHRGVAVACPELVALQLFATSHQSVPPAWWIVCGRCACCRPIH